MNYLFYLGRDPELSVLELVSFFNRTKRSYKILERTSKTLIVSLDKFDYLVAMHCLGGTVKIGQEVKDVPEFIEKLLVSWPKEQVHFGFTSTHVALTQRDQITQVIKTVAKKYKIKSLQRYGKDKEIVPSKANHLDLEFVLHKKKNYHVVAQSDPKDYANRDEKRPHFDALKVTSVRLAKILVNLTQAKKGGTILDPFCGLGTLLQEASLMGFDVIGADQNPQTVQRCRKNLSWLKKQKKKVGRSKVHNASVAKLPQQLNPREKIAGLATEPYLGPYLKKLPKESEARQIAKSLSFLYKQFLNSITKILKPGVKAVIIVPVFKTRDNKQIRIGFETLLKKHGWKITQPYPKIPLPIKYTLKNSKIQRKIYIVERLK